jgi:hypothetical protein
MDRLPLSNRLDNRLLKLATAYHYSADYLVNSIENPDVRKRYADLLSVQTANGRDRVYGSEKAGAGESLCKPADELHGALHECQKPCPGESHGGQPGRESEAQAK